MAKPKIRLEVLDDESQHFCVYFERPGRIEIAPTPDGKIIAHVYRGAKINTDQRPIGMYDGTIDENNSWSK